MEKRKKREQEKMKKEQRKNILQMHTAFRIHSLRRKKLRVKELQRLRV